MFVGVYLPEEIHLETDVVLEYTHHWTLKLFADRLPIVHRSLLEKILNDGSDISTTLWEGFRPVLHKYRSHPHGWMISPAFSGVAELVKQLDLPKDPEEVLFSKLWTVDEFTGIDTAKYPAYQEFTIETFGLRVTRVPDHYIVHEYPSFPNPFSLPRYWLTPSLELIQIRRIRVFNSSIRRWRTQSIYSPVTGDEPVLFLEERWHPKYWERSILGGLAGRKTSSSPRVERCFRMARRILSGNVKRGRRQGTRTYPLGAEFYLIAQNVYLRLTEQLKRPAATKEVAHALGLSKSSFHKYWNSTDRLYPPITPYFRGES
jgi:hypothetical protein